MSPGQHRASRYFWDTTSHKNNQKMNPNTPVESIMTSNLVTVRPDTPLNKVAEVFSKHNFHHLPVTDGQGMLLGIISREDFAKVAYILSFNENGKGGNAICASDVMSKYPLSLSPEDSIGLAADIFLANKFHALPIIEGGVLVGLVTTHDLIAYSFDSPVEESEELTFDEE